MSVIFGDVKGDIGSGIIRC